LSSFQLLALGDHEVEHGTITSFVQSEDKNIKNYDKLSILIMNKMILLTHINDKCNIEKRTCLDKAAFINKCIDTKICE
jgi:hypothetical protein